jgi:hypothetical protein
MLEILEAPEHALDRGTAPKSSVSSNGWSWAGCWGDTPLFDLAAEVTLVAGQEAGFGHPTTQASGYGERTVPADHG